MRAFQPKKGRGLFARLRAAASNRRGVAILMVIAVLAALVALASPFVMSMVLHGRQARNELTSLQARTGAEASIAHATAQLYKTALRTDPLSTDPYVTTPAQLRVSMDFPAAAIQMEQLGVNVQNTSGLLWSAKVEDEQGKINITTAHPALLGNLMGSAILTETANRGATQLIVDDASHFRKTGGLIYLNGEQDAIRYTSISGNAIQLAQGVAESHLEGGLVYDGRALVILDAKFRGRDSYTPLRSIYEMKEALGTRDSIGPDEFARWERHITVQSGMDSPLWGHGEPQPGNTSDVAVSVENVTVAKGDGFTPGGMVRSVVDGVPASFSRIGHVNLRNDGSATIRAHPNLTIPGKQPGRSGQQTFVVFQPQFQHPININTATTEVLEAVFMGVCIYGGKEAVTREKAQLLVDTLREGGRVFATKDQLRKAIDEAYNRGILTVAQRDAVFINATEPNSPRLRTSTVPFTFHTYGHLTIEGSGVVNSENGIQLSRNTQRQLLSLPTPWPGHFHIAYQREFQALLDKGLGSRVVTFPTPLPSQRLKRVANEVKLGMEHSGGIRLDVGQSGLHGYQNEFYESCDDPNDPGYRQDGYDMSKRGPFDLAKAPNRASSTGSMAGRANNQVLRFGGQPNPNNSNTNQPRRGTNPNSVAAQPTAVEMWYKPIGGGQAVFYDESLEENRNRVTFSYQPGEGLKVEICDAGFECEDARTNGWTHLQRSPVQYIFPVELTSGDWHHVAATWMQGGYNGIEIRYDAQTLPPRGETIIQKPGTKLASSLSPREVLELELEEAPDEDFPAKGAIQIGEEIIEYQEKQGTKLKRLTRGSRMTAATQHNDGEGVMPYGFSVGIGEDWYRGLGLLVDRLAVPSKCRTTVFSAKGFILETENKIEVQDASEFPTSGYVMLGAGEVAYYKKRTATTLECERGLEGTTRRRLDNGTGVRLISLEVTQFDEYPANDGIVQIDDETDEKRVEWIDYGSKRDNQSKKYFFARQNDTINHNPSDPRSPRIYSGPPNPASTDPNLRNGTPIAGTSKTYEGMRNKFGIGNRTIGRESAHSKKAKVIPVIRVAGPQCGGFNPDTGRDSAYGEKGVSEISVVERGSTNGELMWVKQAYINQWPHAPNCIWDDWYFDYFIGLNDFLSRRYSQNSTRILKWPSGELPDSVNAKRMVGANRDGEGQIRGHVDEIKVNILNARGARIAMTLDGVGITADSQTILLEEYFASPDHRRASQSINWPQKGLIRIEDELIYYEGANEKEFLYYADTHSDLSDGTPERFKADRRWYTNCVPPPPPQKLNKEKAMGFEITKLKRGVLGTEAKAHPVGAKALLMDGFGVAALTAISYDDLTISDGRGFPFEGYVWINDEVISYTGSRRGGGSPSAAGSSGVTLTGISNYRGRFGTREDSHAIGDVVRFLPFRYWDRNPIFEDGEGVAFVQGGYFAQDAVFDSIQLETKGTEEYPKPNAVRPRIIARFNGKPSWGNEPTNKDGGLWEFKNKEGTIPLRTDYGRGVRADQAEVRVYWEYKTGAFIPNSDWKRTFQIEKLGANYKTPMIMRRLDEIERR